MWNRSDLPKIDKYHSDKMDEMDMNIDEYCNHEGLNIDEILEESNEDDD